MKTEVLLITPEIAKKMLLKNTLNRVVKERLIAEYARQMAAGLWKEETGEAIKISCNNNILDGQHRLLALVNSNVSLSFLVISDLENDIFTVLDTGVTRSTGDIFHIAGIAQSNNYASMIIKYLKLSRGNINVLSGQTRSSSGIRYSGFSRSEVFSLYNSREKFWKAALLMSDKWHNQFQRVLCLSEISSLYTFFFDINQDDAFAFMDLLCSGINLDKNNPIKFLREKLIFSKTNMKFKLTATQKLGIIFKTWNHFRAGSQISVLRFHRETDNFPVPK